MTKEIIPTELGLKKVWADALNRFKGKIGVRVHYCNTEAGHIVDVDDRWVYVHYDDSGDVLPTHPVNLEFVYHDDNYHS